MKNKVVQFPSSRKLEEVIADVLCQQFPAIDFELSLTSDQIILTITSFPHQLLIEGTTWAQVQSDPASCFSSDFIIIREEIVKAIRAITPRKLFLDVSAALIHKSLNLQ